MSESLPRVLYVDDEPTLVFLITRALEKLGIRPDANVVIASGCIDPADVRRAADIGVRTVIQKPAKAAEMAQPVSGLLGDLRS